MELIPVFKNGLRELAAEAERLGQIMGPETVRQLDQAGDKIDQIVMRFKAGFAPAVAGVASAVGEIWDFLDKIIGSMGAFAGGFLGTKGSSMEKIRAGFEASDAHFADVERRRAAERATPEPQRKTAEPTHVPTQKELDDLGKRFGGKANLLADGTIAFSGGPVGGGARKDSGQQFGFSSAQDILKENKDLKEIAKHSARDVKVLEEILAEIRRRNTGSSGPFGSQ